MATKSMTAVPNLVKFMDFQSALEILREHMDTEPETFTEAELAVGYSLMAALRRDSEKMTKRLRDPILDALEGVEPEPGNKHPRLQHGEFFVEGRMRTSVKFNPQKAEPLLTQAGLFDAASTTVVTQVHTPEVLRSRVQHALDLIEAGKTDELVEHLTETRDTSFAEDAVVTEEKVEELVDQNLLSTDDVTQMYDIKETVALYGSD